MNLYFGVSPGIGSNVLGIIVLAAASSLTNPVNKWGSGGSLISKMNTLIEEDTVIGVTVVCVLEPTPEFVLNPLSLTEIMILISPVPISWSRSGRTIPFAWFDKEGAATLNAGDDPLLTPLADVSSKTVTPAIEFPPAIKYVNFAPESTSVARIFVRTPCGSLINAVPGISSSYTVGQASKSPSAAQLKSHNGGSFLSTISIRICPFAVPGGSYVSFTNTTKP